MGQEITNSASKVIEEAIRECKAVNGAKYDCAKIEPLARALKIAIGNLQFHGTPAARIALDEIENIFKENV